jgi:hypothetical protein
MERAGSRLLGGVETRAGESVVLAMAAEDLAAVVGRSACDVEGVVVALEVVLVCRRGCWCSSGC